MLYFASPTVKLVHVIVLAALAACRRGEGGALEGPSAPSPDAGGPSPEAAAPSPFLGTKAGDERVVAGVKVRWCPPGTFTFGSPPDEPERRPGEDQVSVTLTKGFWMATFEATQGDWKRVSGGSLPGELTSELPAGDDYPVGNGM